jgi:hypothetical protein
MTRFYQSDLGAEPDNPFARDANNKLVRRSYWLDMNDRSLVLALTQDWGSPYKRRKARHRMTQRGIFGFHLFFSVINRIHAKL